MTSVSDDATQAPQIILFDLGGVLVEWNGTKELVRLVGDRMSSQDAFNFWLYSPAVLSFECGLCTPEEFSRQAVAELDLEMEPEEWLELFISWDRGPVPGATELLAELGACYPLGCLSNNNELHWGKLRDRYGLGQLFSRQYLSHEIGLCKPDPRLFQYVLNDLNLPPETVLYLDDSSEIVATAQTFGIRAVQARGIEEVRNVLSREKLI